MIVQKYVLLALLVITAGSLVLGQMWNLMSIF